MIPSRLPKARRAVACLDRRGDTRLPSDDQVAVGDVFGPVSCQRAVAGEAGFQVSPGRLETPEPSISVGQVEMQRRHKTGHVLGRVDSPQVVIGNLG